MPKYKWYLRESSLDEANGTINIIPDPWKLCLMVTHALNGIGNSAFIEAGQSDRYEATLHQLLEKSGPTMVQPTSTFQGDLLVFSYC